MSRVTRVDELLHTCGWGRSHKWMSHVRRHICMSHVTHINEWRDSIIYNTPNYFLGCCWVDATVSCHTCRWVKSHIWTNEPCHTCESVTHMQLSSLLLGTCCCATSHVWRSHVTHVMSRMWMNPSFESHILVTSGQWVTFHVCMSHVTRVELSLVLLGGCYCVM